MKPRMLVGGPVPIDNTFIAWMSAHDDDNLPDGAWFAKLEAAGEEWLRIHPEKGRDGNDMAHRYLRMLKW